MKILLRGIGGQGVKKMGEVMAEYIKEKGQKVAMYNLYDNSIRGGSSASVLVFAEANPKLFGENNIECDLERRSITEAGKLAEIFEVPQNALSTKSINLYFSVLLLKRLKLLQNETDLDQLDAIVKTKIPKFSGTIKEFASG